MSRRLGAQRGRQVHRRDLSKNLKACGPRAQPSHLTRNTVAALRSYCEWWLQVGLGRIRLSLSFPFRLRHTFQLSPASEALPPPSETTLLIRASEGL
jgi:hypothetical protein